MTYFEWKDYGKRRENECIGQAHKQALREMGGSARRLRDTMSGKQSLSSLPRRFVDARISFKPSLSDPTN